METTGDSSPTTQRDEPPWRKGSLKTSFILAVGAGLRV